MRIGASTACFFPLLTEKALDNVLNLGFEQAEIFFNTSSELEDAFVKELKQNADIMILLICTKSIFTPPHFWVPRLSLFTAPLQYKSVI